ncbi:uncharacterized protein LOC143232792 isoform X2 [Tachypleus tridentatus]|uniref:uncharacterized protein LOC143232792 isoform X2 n=1 Tax=Tachypleus tridentatus TaxID=6853 RepID=UPI003FD25CD1
MTRLILSSISLQKRTAHIPWQKTVHNRRLMCTRATVKTVKVFIFVEEHLRPEYLAQLSTVKKRKLYYRGLFKCGEDGHMSRDCPNVGGDMRSKSGCFKYGEDGHVSRAIKNPDKQVGHDDGCHCGSLYMVRGPLMVGFVLFFFCRSYS